MALPTTASGIGGFYDENGNIVGTAPEGEEAPIITGDGIEEEPTTFSEVLALLRALGKEQTKLTKVLMRPDMYNEAFYTANPAADVGEMKANIMLSVRHTEDAVMRLGKVLQAMAGGKSINDK